MANFQDVFSSGRQGADEGGASHLDGANGGRNGSPHVRKTHLYSRIILSCRERRYRLRSRNPQGDRHNGPDPRSRGCAIHTQDAWEPRPRSVEFRSAPWDSAPARMSHRRASNAKVGLPERSRCRAGMKDDAAQLLWPTSLHTRVADQRGSRSIGRSN